MRKLLVLMIAVIISAVCFSACANGEKENDMEVPKFTETEWSGIEWEKIEFPIDSKEVVIPKNVKAISTKEEAINIGKAIIKNFWENNKFTNYILLTVVHSTKDNVWRFDYSIDQRKNTDGTYLLCGGFYVAIDGSNCNVIKAWVEE